MLSCLHEITQTGIRGHGQNSAPSRRIAGNGTRSLPPKNAAESVDRSPHRLKPLPTPLDRAACARSISAIPYHQPRIKSLLRQSKRETFLLSDLISPHEPVFTPKRGFRETFRVFLSNLPDGLSSYFACQFIRSRQRSSHQPAAKKTAFLSPTSEEERAF